PPAVGVYTIQEAPDLRAPWGRRVPAGTDLERSLELVLRPGQVSGARQKPRKADVDLRVARPLPALLPRGVRRTLPLPQGAHQGAEPGGQRRLAQRRRHLQQIVRRGGVARVVVQRLQQLAASALPLPTLLQRNAELIVGPGIAGRDRDRLLKQL